MTNFIVLFLVKFTVNVVNITSYSPQMALMKVECKSTYIQFICFVCLVMILQSQQNKFIRIVFHFIFFQIAI